MFHDLPGIRNALVPKEAALLAIYVINWIDAFEKSVGRYLRNTKKKEFPAACTNQKARNTRLYSPDQLV
jgi:hypothetical protein